MRPCLHPDAERLCNTIASYSPIGYHEYEFTILITEGFAMRVHFTLPIMVAVIALCAISCSHESGDPLTLNPSAPPALDTRITQETGANKHLWGLWDVAIDPEVGAVETVPLRGVEFTCDVVWFLQPPGGSTSNMTIKIIDLTEFNDTGRIDVEVILTHPFPGLDTFTGFDVLGVFVHDGDELSEYDSDIFYGRRSEVARLLNSDGLTRWYNPKEFTATGILGFTEGALGNKGLGFTATINGYKYYADGLNSEDDLTGFLHMPGVVDRRGLFSSTASNSRLYELQFPMVGGSPLLMFQYAVVASWESPDPTPPLDIPGDFPISANAFEPFHLSIADNGSQLYYSGGVGGGVVRIRVELFDWNAPYNPSGILGEFSKVIIESPNADVLGDCVIFTPDEFAPYIQQGTAVSSVAELEFIGVEPTGPEDVEFLVTLEAKGSETYNQGFGVPVPDATLASYFTFTLPVGDNPCGNFSVTGADPSPGQSGEFYPDFTVEGENFQDGLNLAVDIFDVSDVVVRATSVVLADINTINCAFDFCGVNPGDYDLRVTNGCEPISYASTGYTIEPDPLKNMDLRPGVAIRDLGVRETTGEPYVLFDDGQLWIYEPDYSSGIYKTGNSALDYMDVLDNGDACLADSSTNGQYIYFLTGDYIQLRGAYGGPVMDTTETDPPGLGDRAYWWADSGGAICSTRRTPPSYGGNITWFYIVGTGPGKVNLSAFRALHTSRDNADSYYTMWCYALEAAPEYAIERYDYYATGGSHSASHDLTICGSQGDGEDELNDPRDISGDADDNIYVLEMLSTGQPAVKVYDMDGNYLGEFGDDVTITGDPLRMDVDEGDGEVHVVHTNGVSVFRPCEIPI